MKIGIVGLPNAGKSSLFNALTRAGAQAANYPFTTVEPNVAVVGVPDERLDQVAATIGATPIVHETIQFHDIAGLVRGAHEGEGLGNQFLGNIRETDAILHVVRVHDDAQVVHPEGRVDPLADVETIETELLFADLEQAERRLERVAKQAKSGDKEAVAEERWLREVVDALREGRARSHRAASPRTRPGPRRGCRRSPRSPSSTWRTSPRASRSSRRRRWWSTRGSAALAPRRSARGWRRSSPSSTRRRRAAMREEMGVARVRARDGDPRGVRAARPDLVLHRRARARRARAWAIQRGTRAREAAGSVHTDMERGFVAAEVTSWEELVEAGGYNAAREQALTARGGPRLRDAATATW